MGRTCFSCCPFVISLFSLFDGELFPISVWRVKVSTHTSVTIDRLCHHNVFVGFSVYTAVHRTDVDVGAGSLLTPAQIKCETGNRQKFHKLVLANEFIIFLIKFQVQKGKKANELRGIPFAIQTAIYMYNYFYLLCELLLHPFGWLWTRMWMLLNI